MTLVLSRTEAQEADLQALIAAQQDPSSSLYHRWLTPDEFAARFGVSDSDIAKIVSWLQAQGFSMERVSRTKDRIVFSGTASQAEAAFETELHYYKSDSRTDYAPSTDVSVPTALASSVKTVANLSSFRPRPHVKFKTAQSAPTANFTSNQSGGHYMTPKDVATIYDVNAAYNSAYTGSGQSIAIVGQSAVVLSDIEKFQSASGLMVKDPTLVLVPSSGTSTVSSGDESESDLDLEYSGAIAKGATIYFVYVGNNANYSVFDSLQYAVDERIAPIISMSYGACETEFSSSEYSTLNSILAQAATQGQTVIAASGDNGSTDCYGVKGLTPAQQKALAVDFPASSQYVTGLGGTEFPSVNVSSSNTTYWTSASGSDVIGSALSYIPEQVWNDDSSSSGIASGGGGVSTLTARPSWQTGVTGIPSGSYRLVPDISLSSSPENAGYLYCSSDSSTGITGSCSKGFRDSNNTYLTVAGGTSFASPIFAGMLAIINQKVNSTGQGVVNSTLYSLASNSTTYASAFHDITSGGNQCAAGATYCTTSGTSQYAAATGYDQASGLGSIDLHNLLTAWPTSSSLQASATTLSAAIGAPASGASDGITITVASALPASTTTPTGTLSIVVDGSTVASSLALTNGTATYTFSSTTTGSHVIQATYSGDSVYAASSGTLTLAVGSSAGSLSKSFTLSATNVGVSAGSSGTSTITINPANGYTGTIGWSVSGNSSSLSNTCYKLANATVSGTSSVTETMTIYTSSSACASASLGGASGLRRFITPAATVSQSSSYAPVNSNPGRGGVAMAGLLFASLIGFRFKRARTFAWIFVVAAFSFAASGCGSGVASPAASTSNTNAAKGSYTLTLTGTDTLSSSIGASTTLNLVIN